jgi:CheY-like chemotaxis protein
MDMQMPEMDGIEATARIRGMEGPKAAVVIIALTANVLPEYREACIKVGMNGFLTKPFQVGAIVTELDKWFLT